MTARLSAEQIEKWRTDMRKSIWGQEAMIEFNALCDMALATSALQAGGEPVAYGVRNDQGYWASCWITEEMAETVRSKGLSSHKDEVVPLFAAPASPASRAGENSS